jgi:hypothetical protein
MPKVWTSEMASFNGEMVAIYDAAAVTMSQFVSEMRHPRYLLRAAGGNLFKNRKPKHIASDDTLATAAV